MKRICANCGRRLQASEIAASYNNEWFACLPCWDKSEGFNGWVKTICVTEALLLRLASAQKDCPGDGVAGRGGSVEHSLCHCTRCDDTGKVFLFPDEVRVECQAWEKGCYHPELCVCQGRGWVPSADPMMWVGGLYQVLSLIFVQQRHRWTDEIWVCWIQYHKTLIRGDFDAALPHAVKAMELARVLGGGK